MCFLRNSSQGFDDQTLSKLKYIKASDLASMSHLRNVIYDIYTEVYHQHSDTSESTMTRIVKSCNEVV